MRGNLQTPQRLLSAVYCCCHIHRFPYKNAPPSQSLAEGTLWTTVMLSVPGFWENHLKYSCCSFPHMQWNGTAMDWWFLLCQRWEVHKRRPQGCCPRQRWGIHGGDRKNAPAIGIVGQEGRLAHLCPKSLWSESTSPWPRRENVCLRW